MKEQAMERPPLSKKMTVLRFRDYRLILGAALLMLGLSAALSCFMLDRGLRREYEEELSRAVLFDSSAPRGYSYIRLQYLTDSFAEHVEDADQYYFGFDLMFRPYIISIRGDLPENLMKLMEYSYADSEAEQPPAVDVRGYGEPIQSELLGYAREAYSLMWEEDQLPVTMEDLTQLVGTYYLDTVPRPYLRRHPEAVMFFMAPVLLLMTGAVFLLSYIKRLRAQLVRLAGKSGELLAADRELLTAAEYVKGSSIYLTEHFIISSSYQFEVIPYSRIRGLEMMGGYVVAVTDDESVHIVAGGRRSRHFSQRLKEELENLCGQHNV